MKIDLTDVTFCIPIRIDHSDRLENLELLVDFLNENFDTNIFVFENDIECHLDRTEIPNKVTKYEFQHNLSPLFHRTKILNDMYKESKTSIVVNYDTDVLMNKAAYLESAELIRSGKFDVVFPYDGRFREVPRKTLAEIRRRGGVEWIDFNDTFYIHHNSVGGAIFVNRDKYRESGYENEHCVSHSWEDNERVARWSALGYKIGRTSNFLIHIEHYRGVNSGPENPNYHSNRLEFEKISRMSKAEVVRYIDTWSWKD